MKTIGPGTGILKLFRSRICREDGLAAACPETIEGALRQPISRSHQCLQAGTYYAGGLRTGVDVPGEELESTRALLRCRTALVEELSRTKHRATQFLQTRGYVYGYGSNWSQKFWEWLVRIELRAADQIVLDMYVDLIHYLEVQIKSLETVIDQEAAKPRYQESVRLLKAFRGIATITALTLASESETCGAPAMNTLTPTRPPACAA